MMKPDFALKFLTMFGDPPVPVATQPQAVVMTSAVDVQQLVNNARKEEKDKLYKDIEKAKKTAKEAEEKAAALEEQLKKKNEEVVAALPADQKLVSQVESIQKMLEAERTARLEAESRLRLESLERYRSEKIGAELAAGRQLIPEFVMGSTPEEIDKSVMIATAEYSRITSEHMAALQKAGYQIVQANQPPQAPPTIPAVPSPHWVAQGLPSVMNAVPAPQAPAMTNEQLASLTSEDSIRNGTYAQVRNQLMANLRAGNPGARVALPTQPAPQIPTQYAVPVQIPQPQYPVAPQYPQQPYPMPQNQPVSPPMYSPTPSMPSTMPAPVAPQFAPPGVQADQMTPAQIAAQAAAIRAAGPRNGGPAAVQTYQQRFANTPPVQPGQ